MTQATIIFGSGGGQISPDSASVRSRASDGAIFASDRAFVLLAQETDRGRDVSLVFDPQAHPARLRRRVAVLLDLALVEQLALAVGWERKVEQRAAVEVPELAAPDEEAGRTEPTRSGADLISGTDLGDDPVFDRLGCSGD